MIQWSEIPSQQAYVSLMLFNQNARLEYAKEKLKCDKDI